MSIIQEALKKAHVEYVEKKTPQTEEVVKPKVEVRVQPQNIKKTVSVRLPVLASILVMLLLVYGLRVPSQYSKPHISASTKTDIKTKADVKINTDIKADAKTNANPAPVVTAASKKPDSFALPKINSILPHPSSMFVLSGIMYMENRPQAIINGHILEEGDKINGATVLIIEKDCVLLDVNDTNLRLDWTNTAKSSTQDYES